jgi:hypothetical protein
MCDFIFQPKKPILQNEQVVVESLFNIPLVCDLAY